METIPCSVYHATGMDTPLSLQHCIPCEGGTVPLERNVAVVLAAQTDGWALSDDTKSISREFTFKDFTEALAFVNSVGAISEEEGHHPDIRWWWNTVKIDLSTHDICGLSNNDFILASKINQLI